MKTLSALFACCCLLAATACGPSQVGSRFVKSQDVKASQGAVIDVSGSDSSVLSGTKLEVPGGALSKDTTITLELGTTDLVANSKASPVAVWGPDGLHFSSPATLTMPLTLAQGQTTDHLNIEVKEGNGSSFRIPRSDLVIAGSSVTFKIDGFTSFQANTQNACMQDSDCSTGETCVNGGCSGGMGGGQGGGNGGGMGGGNGGGGGNVCQTDTDCPMGQACRNGACTGGQGGGQGGGMGGGQGGGSNTCMQDSDCPMGDVCQNGACVGGQGGGMGGGQGGGNPDGGLICMQDSDCPSGDVCTNGQCGPGNDGGTMCRLDSDCPNGEVCDVMSGTCVNGNNDGGVDGGQPDGGPNDGGMDGGQPDAGPSDGGNDGGQPDAGQTCQTDLDCPMPELCVQNFCEAIGCDMNRPCPGNYQCVNNWCQ